MVVSIVTDKSGNTFVIRENNSIVTIRVDKKATIKVLADDFFEVVNGEKDIDTVDDLARKFWGLVAWNASINPTMDGVPITYDKGRPDLRAFCRSLAKTALQ